jgi:hypothetical protein
VSFFMQTEGLPQKPDFQDQDDLWRGQRPGKVEGELWVSFFLTECLHQKPDLRTRVNSGEARGHAKKKKEGE